MTTEKRKEEENIMVLVFFLVRFLVLGTNWCDFGSLETKEWRIPIFIDSKAERFFLQFLYLLAERCDMKDIYLKYLRWKLLWIFWIRFSPCTLLHKKHHLIYEYISAEFVELSKMKDAVCQNYPILVFLW